MSIYLGKCPKPGRYDNVLYAIAVADWYFHGGYYLVGLFLKETGHSQSISDCGEF